MIAVTKTLLKVLEVYRVFLSAVGLTWIFIAYEVFLHIHVSQIGLKPFPSFNDLFAAYYLVVFLCYLMYASFYGVYGVSRQIHDYNRVGTVIINLRLETFLAVVINVGISAVVMDHLIDIYGLSFRYVVLIMLLIFASSFTRHPVLRRVVNFFRVRVRPKKYVSSYPLEDK